MARHLSGGSGGLLEKLRVLSAEKDALVEEKATLQKRLDELQLQMEHQVLKGDFNPVSTRVLHLRFVNFVVFMCTVVAVILVESNASLMFQNESCRQC